MNRATKVIGITIAAAAVVGLSAASEATTAHSQAPAGGGAGTTSNATVLVYRQVLGGFQSVSLPGYRCPADHPWLLDRNYSPGRLVPSGVQVIEPGGIGVTILDPATDADGYVTGWKGNSGSATNWGFSGNVLEIYAHCTDDPSQARNTGSPLSSAAAVGNRL